MSTREWNEVDTEFQDKFIRYKEYHESWDRDTFPIDVEYKILTKENPAQSCINYLYSKFENKIVAEDLVLTFTDENRRWKIFEQSPDNEWGIPQLTYRLHKDFIESKYFADCYNQIDYAVDVYYDWKYRK